MVVLIISLLVPLAIAAIICSDTLAQRKREIIELTISRDAWTSAWLEKAKRMEQVEKVNQVFLLDLIEEKRQHLIVGNELARLVDAHKQITEELAQLKASIATEALRKRPLWRALADRIASGDKE